MSWYVGRYVQFWTWNFQRNMTMNICSEIQSSFMKGGAATETGFHSHRFKKSSLEGTWTCPPKSRLLVPDAWKPLCFLKPSHSRFPTSYGKNVLYRKHEIWNQKIELAPHLCHILAKWSWLGSYFSSLSLSFFTHGLFPYVIFDINPIKKVYKIV